MNVKIALSIPGFGNVDSGLPKGVPAGGLFNYDTAGKQISIGGTGISIIHVFIELTLIAAIFFTLYLVGTGGLDMITSGGEKEKLKRGREKFIYALVGLALVFLSFTMLGAISAFFGVNLLPFLFPNLKFSP